MKLADVSIRRPVTTTMVILAIVTYGAIAYNRLGLDLFPNIDFPIVTVTTVYRGADPESIETKVSRRIEDAVNQVGMIKMVRSSSLQNVSVVVVQFELGKDIDVAAQEVRDKITAIQRDLPADIEPPLVQKVDLGAAPVLTLAVSGDAGVGEADLYRFADETVRKQVQMLEGVGNVEIVGGRERTIWVYLDPERLLAHHLSPEDVARALGAQNIEVPAGNARPPGQEVAVKTRGLVRSVAELRDLPLTTLEGAVIRLRDVASVEDGLEEQRSASHLGDRPTLALVVTKQPGTNTVEVAERVRASLPILRSLAPAGVTIEVPVDNARFIENSVHEALLDLEIGAVLAVLIIGVFLRNLRMTLIAAVAIPTSVIGTFAAIKMLGFTLNYLTLLGLSLSVGLLVDDAIVVLENIFRHFEGHGDRRRAAHEATAEIGLAVLATTFSLVAVFFPIATTGGMVGRFLKEFGITVSVAVLISLFVSFTLTPMLSARVLKEPARNLFTRGVEAALAWLDRGYGAVVGWALSHRAVVLGVAVATLAATLYVARLLPKEMMTAMDQAEFNVKVETPPGSSLARTQAVVDEVVDLVSEFPEVRYTLSTIGGGAGGQVEKGTIYVRLSDPHERARSQDDVMQAVRARLQSYRKATVLVEPRAVIDVGMSNAPVQLHFLGDDLSRLDALARDTREFMERAGGYTDIDISYKPAKPEYGVLVDRDRAALLGVPVAQVGMALRFLFEGEKVSEFRAGGDTYDVRLRLREEDRRDLHTALRLGVRSRSGELVALDNLVRTQAGASAQEITRLYGRRAVSLYANLTPDKALGTAVDELNAHLKDRMPEGYAFRYTGQADFMRENFEALSSALILGVIMIYFILASQFESFLHPFTIMLSLPFSFIGAIGALLLTGRHLSILAMIGFIMLMGLVTKNAILLVDFAIRRHASGMPLREAIIEAGTIRLRPILMTTAAMIFGMLPIALARSLGSEARAPMAVAVIGGLTTSTLLTLVVVPVMFHLFESAKARVFQRK